MKQIKIEILRHSLSHILAAAVQELYPGVKFGIGPVIENGFYYDFDFDKVILSRALRSTQGQAPRDEESLNLNVILRAKPEESLNLFEEPLTFVRDSSSPSAPQNDKKKLENDKKKLTPEDLPKIEKKMREIIKKGLKFEKEEWPIDKAVLYFEKSNQNYKVELIKEIKSSTRSARSDNNYSLSEARSAESKGKVTIYKLGDFIDLCRGPHLKSTKEINSDGFKLTKIAGAYWRGDEKNPMLTRIYGIAFENGKELDNFLKKQAEAEKRDHRKLGQELDFFHIDEEFGAGLPLWHPKGALLRRIIEDYWVNEHLKNGYELLRTPHIARLDLWQKSGHWDFYRENMYSPMDIEGEKYIVKPMNCPGHILIYKTKIRSYRELPLRWAELGTVYRYERSGVLHGLTRVRGFTQDDAHTFCAPEQLEQEIISTLQFGLKMLKIFGFKDYDIYLSTRPKKYAGELKNWGKATKALENALKKQGLKYQIDQGEGVFYGPKIDIKIKDSLGRAWQCTTIQVDFNLPEKFAVTYVNQKGKKQPPIMIHRALLGSLERFVGVLIEHYAGALPVWLSPVQLWIIPVGSRHKKYANFVGKQLTAYNLRLKIKDQNETVSKKIREGELQKIPYMLVVGDEEKKTDSIRVRDRKKGDIGMIKIEKFIEKIQEEIEKKK